jgi:hypothetical protein
MRIPLLTRTPRPVTASVVPAPRDGQPVRIGRAEIAQYTYEAAREHAEQLWERYRNDDADYRPTILVHIASTYSMLAELSHFANFGPNPDRRPWSETYTSMASLATVLSAWETGTETIPPADIPGTPENPELAAAWTGFWTENRPRNQAAMLDGTLRDLTARHAGDFAASVLVIAADAIRNRHDGGDRS